MAKAQQSLHTQPESLHSLYLQKLFRARRDIYASSAEDLGLGFSLSVSSSVPPWSLCDTGVLKTEAAGLVPVEPAFWEGVGALPTGLKQENISSEDLASAMRQVTKPPTSPPASSPVWQLSLWERSQDVSSASLINDSCYPDPPLITLSAFMSLGQWVTVNEHLQQISCAWFIAIS